MVNAGIVAVLGGWLEPVWGSGKLAVFVVVVNVLAGMGTYVQLLMVYVVTRYSQAMYVMQICIETLRKSYIVERESLILKGGI